MAFLGELKEKRSQLSKTVRKVANRDQKGSQEQVQNFGLSHGEVEDIIDILEKEYEDMQRMKCVQECALANKKCRKKSCRYWIDYKEDLNCTYIAIRKHGRMTLREVADRQGLTFARIQQIERTALKKIAKRFGDLKIFLTSDKDYQSYKQKGI